MSTSNKLTKLGRYDVGEMIGKGGMGVVYKGHDPRLGRDVALKTIRADALTTPGQSEELVVRLRREAGAAARLSHPNVVTIFDIDETDGYVFVAMELMKGTPLDEVLAERSEPDLQQVEYLIPICEALEHLHTHGIIHRDLKPANIMVMPDGLVKLMDFGIAKDLMSNDITQTGAVMGTPIYMAPEQFLGEAIDARSDLFAAGVLLFDICCKGRPFPGNTPMAIMQQIMNEKPQSPRELNPRITPALEATILKSLEREREKRFQSAEEMAGAVELCLDEMTRSGALPRNRKGIPMRRTTRAITEAGGPGTEAAVAPAPQAPESAPGLDEMATIPPTAPGAASAPTVADAPAAASTAAKSSKGPLMAGLAVAAAVVLGAGGYFATRAPDTEGAAAAVPSPGIDSVTPVETPRPSPASGDSPQTILGFGPEWIGGELILDYEASYEIPESGRVIVPAANYEVLELRQRCIVDVEVQAPTGLATEKFKSVEVKGVPDPDCE